MDRPARDILFFAQRVPYPPDRGDRITTWHLLRHFLGRGDRVRVACFLESERDESSARELRSMGCELAAARIHPRLRKLRCLPGLLGRQPLTLPYFFDRGLLEQCRSWARERPPGIGFAYSSSSGQYFLALGPLLRDCRKVMHFAELDSDKWAQYA
ncbi:MAG: hypothetical protein ACE5F1_23065, partial [Planctomycetota bacterium]